MIERRGFLKVLGAIAASTGIIHYAEAKVLMPEQGSWIEDKGDYYIVRIPDGKTFAHETLDKPTIFGFGQDSRVEYVTVNGFVNMYMPRGGYVYGSKFDASKCAMHGRREVILVDGENCNFRTCDITGPKMGIETGVRVLPSAEQIANARLTGRPIEYRSYP